MDFSFLEVIGIILIVGIIGFYFFKAQLKSQDSQQKVELFADRKKDALPIKLQAYERMLLFCERVNPIKMLVRVKPKSDVVEDYLFLLLQNIEQEFEHNLVQQLYISEECWNVIIASKSAIINKLKQVASTSKNTQEFREKMMIAYQNSAPATDTAIAYLKKDIKKII
ncbi:hypothetical protein [Polaribacter uvawellassae]|uniref:DUF7935 family protein n=1 Tax=Polaribacter uvawellassae TaxID=3133495 RepID=UPI003219D57D